MTVVLNPCANTELSGLPPCALITSNNYFDWMLDRAFMYVPAQTYVSNFMETFKEFPPRQKAASFSLDQVMEKLSPPSG